MNENKLGQEPAFPIIDQNSSYYRTGISQRLFIATKCINLSNKLLEDTTVEYISGFIEIKPTDYKIEYYSKAVVKLAYQFADELLKQENL